METVTTRGIYRKVQLSDNTITLHPLHITAIYIYYIHHLHTFPIVIDPY